MKITDRKLFIFGLLLVLTIMGCTQNNRRTIIPSAPSDEVPEIVTWKSCIRMWSRQGPGDAFLKRAESTTRGQVKLGLWILICGLIIGAEVYCYQRFVRSEKTGVSDRHLNRMDIPAKNADG